MKLDREQESKAAEEKNSALVSSMQSQKAQIVDEIEELKLTNKALQEELVASKEHEKQTQGEGKTGAKEATKSKEEMLAALNDPNKFVEAAKSLNLRQLQWVNYQLGLMVNSGYPQMPGEAMMPGQYPMAQPQMYPYYQYPMMPMYKGPYLPYHDETED